MRLPWPENFPKTFVNAMWRNGADGLGDHEHYEAAKSQMDLNAAICVVEDIAKDRLLDVLIDCWQDHSHPPIKCIYAIIYLRTVRRA